MACRSAQLAPHPLTIVPDSPAEQSSRHLSPLDALLLAQMESGDAVALGAFYDRWEQVVRAAATDLLRDEARVEPVVEAVFWHTWRNASRFATSMRTDLWLVALTRNQCGWQE